MRVGLPAVDTRHSDLIIGSAELPYIFQGHGAGAHYEMCLM